MFRKKILMQIQRGPNTYRRGTRLERISDGLVMQTAKANAQANVTGKSGSTGTEEEIVNKESGISIIP